MLSLSEIKPKEDRKKDQKKNKKINKKRRIPSMPIPGQLTSPSPNPSHCERVPLCTSGSLTVEAAVILPLFLFAMLTLVCLMDLCWTQVIKQVELGEKAKKLSMYAYLSSEYLETEYIDLYETENCKLPVSLIPGYTIPLALRGRVHSWTGRSDSECEADREVVAEEMVYVAEHESVYHISGKCTYLKLSICGVSKENLRDERNHSGSRYQACEKCCQSGDDTSYYFICPNGEKYHSSRACSGLSRKVRLVAKSEVEHLSVCSRCGG